MEPKEKQSPEQAEIQRLQKQVADLQRQQEESKRPQAFAGDPPEVARMAEEKMAAGLSREFALECARNQYNHDLTNPHDPLPDPEKKPEPSKAKAKQ